MARALNLFALSLLALTGAQSASAEPPAAEIHQVGAASFVGPRQVGAKTASGERFDPKRLTAASRTLPLGSQVRVTNLATGKSVTVTVNDRGPFARGRIMDVSPAAAAKLGMKTAGVSQVAVDAAPDTSAGEDQPRKP
jgi:rare lipoprotein A